jgi:PAS domain S-box-containing protein
MTALAFIIIALMTVVVLLVQARLAQRLNEAARARGESVARTIGAVVSPSLLSYNYVALGQAARQSAQDPGIAYVIIHDKEGRVAGDSRRAEAGGERPDDAVGRAASEAREVLVQLTRVAERGHSTPVLDVAAPVFIEGSADKWGTVRVGLSLAPVRSEVAKTTWILVALGVVAGLVSLGGARAAARSVTEPIRLLALGTLDVAAGRRSQRLELPTGDEIEELAEHFNHMAGEVERQRAEAERARGELVALNASLEAEVRRRSDELVQVERRYKVLVEAAPIGVAMGVEKRLQYVNPAFCTMFGRSPSEVLGDDFDAVTLVHPDDRERVVDLVKSWDGAGVLGPFEIRLLTPAHEERALEVRGMALEFDGHPAQLYLITDVTAVRKLQDRLNTDLRMRALGELSSGVAHDFNNLLGIILGRAQLLSRRSADPEVRKGLEVIQRAAADGAMTVRRIQDYARQRSGHSHVPLDVGEVVRDVIEMTRGKWQEETRQHGVAIEVETHLAHRSTVRGNAPELREALTNLVLNAVDAMPRGGRLRFASGEADGTVWVQVTDTGRGMTPEVAARAFDPFFSTKDEHGTGLGLSIAYSIAARHEGTLELVETFPGRGSTFVLRLPACTSQPEREARKPKVQPVTGVSALVVEDEPEVRMVLVEMLESQGYRVSQAEGGAQALELLGRDRFDLVLTDLGMPVVSGWEVAREARRRWPRTVVALVTGWAENLAGEDIGAGTVDLVIAKPFDLNDASTRLAEALATRAKAA